MELHKEHCLRSFIENNEAVSPVVATLLLIMVVAGGVAFISALSQDVSSQTSSVVGKSNSIEITSIKINILGSELVKPAIDALAKAYNDKQLGVVIQSQGSGNLGITSGSGIASTGAGTIDIGTSDRKPTPAELEKYPNLNLYKLGTSGIVMIVNNGTDPDPVELVKRWNLQKLYSGSYTTPRLNFYNNTGYTSYINDIKAYQMAGSPGTEKAFLQYINLTSIDPSIPEVTGNAGMLEAVKNTPKSVGFIEYGYVDTQEERGSIYIAGLWDDSESYNGTDNTDSSSDIRYNNTYLNVSNFTLASASSSASNPYYPLELAHPLYFVTNGKPSSLADSFIKWAKSYEGQDIIEKAGYVSYLREIEQ